MTDAIRIEIVLEPAAVDAIVQRVFEMVASGTQATTPSPYLTIRETAELLRCTRGRVDNLLSQGRLTRVKEGGRTLIARAELDAYLAGEPTGPVGRKSRLGR